MQADLNLSWITPLLAVGGRVHEEQLAPLARVLGIRRVVDVRIECCDDAERLREHGIELLHLPTHDHHAIAGGMLERGVRWVLEQLRREQPVLIHCEHGIGRSVLLTWCALIALGQEPRSALLLIKRARARASPSPVQIEALRAFCAGRGVLAPSWDELADIAYANIREARTDHP
jgi:protein-tyrosine phosphatase